MTDPDDLAILMRWAAAAGARSPDVYRIAATTSAVDDDGDDDRRDGGRRRDDDRERDDDRAAADETAAEVVQRLNHERLLGLWRAAFDAVEEFIEATRAGEAARAVGAWTTGAHDTRRGPRN